MVERIPSSDRQFPPKPPRRGGFCRLTPSSRRRYRRGMRCIAHSLSIFLALGAATGVPNSASADNIHPKAGPSDRSTVKEHVRRGQKARKAGLWTEATAEYKAALEAADAATSTEVERAELAGELGLCELALHKYRDAAEHLARSLEQREALPEALQQRFEAGQRKAAPHVARLVLGVDPPDAEVLVDGKRIGRTARTYTLFFEPGQHMVRGRAPGCKDALHSLRAVAGAEHEFTMPLLCAAASGTKEARSSKGTATATPTPVRALPAPRAQAPSPWASWPGTLRVVGISLATGTVSAGAILMISASKLDQDMSARRDQLQSNPRSSSSMCWQAPDRSPCGELRRLRDARNLSDRVGMALVITGGVIGAATAASFFTDFSFLGRTPAQDGVNVSPVVTGHETGVSIEGVW
ncbi:hypothetical protein WMF45_46290 [Sorangium sp. So ce448]|uniref:hypothetical protein n=1 Tax=Sorangium sp. So ce448 TaxID=3133314 RepID=UPI003F643FC9